MSRKYFGTDGIRGRANTGAMTAPFMVQLATAVGQYFKENAETRRVVIGKDTRRSGYMLENALTSGFMAAGLDVFMLGPLPTPAVGLLTRSMRADLGVMISASHNPHHDNGIKFFGPDGYKLSDKDELAIEALVDALLAGTAEAPSGDIGRATQLHNSATRYVEYAKTTVDRRVQFNGLRIVLDCANGAAYKAAPEILWELGAEVIPLGIHPDGFNINKGCGSTQPDAAAKLVRETRADLGICLDGDADRIILLDETGTVVDGDQIMALLATHWAKDGKLNHNTLVATVMSNLGLETHLAEQGITLNRTQVGDRYVVEEMRRGGFNMGGEQSGHIVLSDHATTGDGLMAGLQVLSILKDSDQKASQLLRRFTPVPQLLQNVRYGAGRAPLDQKDVQEAIATGEKALAGSGRLLIRKSGTEPLVRVMGESHDGALLKEVVGAICDTISNHA